MRFNPTTLKLERRMTRGVWRDWWLLKYGGTQGERSYIRINGKTLSLPKRLAGKKVVVRLEVIE